MSALLFAGCASTPQSSAILENAEGLPPAYRIPNMPFVSQLQNQCGPSALAMVSQKLGYHYSTEDFTPKMLTPAKNGTFQTDFISATRRIGLMSFVQTSLSTVLREVTRNHPVVVLQNLGSDLNPVWHYSVMHGYDLSKEKVLLHFGNQENLEMTLSSFERTWKKSGYWSLLILAPGDLPETTSLVDAMDAASALERSKQFEPAIRAYQSIAARWPEDPVVWFGLGNVYFTTGQLRASEKSYLTALKFAPDSGEIWNNLSEVYSKLGLDRKAKNAEHMAHKLMEQNPSAPR